MTPRSTSSDASATDAACSAQPTVVAAFDFDHTLTTRDSFPLFLWFLSTPWTFAVRCVLLLPVLVQYAWGRVSNADAKTAVYRRFIRGLPEDDVRAMGAAFARERIPGHLDPVAMDRLRWHQNQGHRTILVSASADVYLRPWAETAGFDDVLCTELDVHDGRYTGDLDGGNCHGPEKARRLQSLLHDDTSLSDDTSAGETYLYAYGDSRGDRELLALADAPYYRRFDALAPYDASEDDVDGASDPETGSTRRSRRGRLLRFLIPVLAGGAALGLVLYFSGDVRETLGLLRSVSPGLVGGLLVVIFAGYLLRFVRWQYYLRVMGHDVPWRSSLSIFLSSFALTATPGKAGESVKAFLLSRRHDVPVPHTLGGLFAERFTDLVSINLILVLSLGFMTVMAWTLPVIGILVVVQGLVIVAMQYPAWIRRRLLLPFAGRARLRPYVASLLDLFDSAHPLLTPRRLGVGLLLGSGPWVAEGIAMYALFDAVGASDVTLWAAVFVHAAATLLGALTFLPGGLGGHEATSVALSVAYGATRTEAATVTLLIRLMTLWFAVGIGICVSAALMPRARRSSRDDLDTVV